MKRTLKWIGILLGGLLGILILAYAAVTAVSASRLNRTYEVTAEFTLDVPDDPASIAEGERLYTIMCHSCHGEDLAGETLADLMSGQIQVANLTAGSGGIGSSRSDEDIARAIREGVRPDGSAISTDMPWETMSLYTDEEVHAIWTYLQTVEPVVNE